MYHFNNSNGVITLTQDEQVVASANFACDPYELTAIVSNLQGSLKHATLLLQMAIGQYSDKWADDDNLDVFCYFPNQEEKSEMPSALATSLLTTADESEYAAKLLIASDTHQFQQQLTTGLTIETLNSESKVKLPSGETLNVISDQTLLLEHASQIRDLLWKHTNWARLWGDEFTVEHVQSRIETATNVLALANPEGQFIGFVRLLTDGDLAYVSNLVIDPSYRQQKLATLLTQSIFATAPEIKLALLIHNEDDPDFALATHKLYIDKFKFSKLADSPLANCFVCKQVSPLQFGLSADQVIDINAKAKLDGATDVVAQSTNRQKVYSSSNVHLTLHGNSGRSSPAADQTPANQSAITAPDVSAPAPDDQPKPIIAAPGKT